MVRTTVRKRKRANSGAASKAKKQRKAINTTRIDRGIIAIAAHTKTVTLIYSDTQVIDPTSSIATHIWSANGCFDPDITGAGHQPAGFDEYMNFYDHYQVMSSKIVAKVIAPETAATANQIWATLYLSDNTNATGSQQRVIENGLCSWSVLGSGTRGTGVMNLTNSFVHDKFFSRRKGDNSIGNSATNPVDGAFYMVSLTAADGGATSNTVRVVVEIQYTVRFTERRKTELS